MLDKNDKILQIICVLSLIFAVRNWKKNYLLLYFVLMIAFHDILANWKTKIIGLEWHVKNFQLGSREFILKTKILFALFTKTFNENMVTYSL